MSRFFIFRDIYDDEKNRHEKRRAEKHTDNDTHICIHENENNSKIEPIRDIDKLDQWKQKQKKKKRKREFLVRFQMVLGFLVLKTWWTKHTGNLFSFLFYKQILGIKNTLRLENDLFNMNIRSNQLIRRKKWKQKDYCLSCRCWWNNRLHITMNTKTIYTCICWIAPIRCDLKFNVFDQWYLGNLKKKEEEGNKKNKTLTIDQKKSTDWFTCGLNRWSAGPFSPS